MKNKKAIIYCFSGTGNTYIAAKKIADALSHYNIKTDVFRVQITSVSSDVCTNSSKHAYDFLTAPNPNEYDIAGFAYPIHAFNTPKFFLSFIKNLPGLDPDKLHMPAYIFKTSGEPFAPNSVSSYALTKLLRKKVFKPCSDVHMLMPYNIMFRYPDAMAKQMYLHTEFMSNKLAHDIAGNINSLPKYNPLWIIFSYILRLEWFGAWINGPLYSVNKNTCISCRKCAENCPSANITFKNKSYKDENGKICTKSVPHFGWACTMCMSCTMGCPKASINPGFITPWKINPSWNFNKIINDESIPSNWTDSPNAKYFKLFRKYYKKYPLMQDLQDKE